MSATAARAATSWMSGLLVAVVLHGAVLLGVRVVHDVPPPTVEVDTTVPDLVRPPPPPPPPPPPAPVAARVKTPAEVAPVRRARKPPPTDNAPPPPSNRPPPKEASPEPVPIVTGVSIPTLKVTAGVRVRAGNTDVPGFEPPPGHKPDDARGYAGGVLGGRAKKSGGRGTPGEGVGGGVRAAKLTKPPRLLRRYRPPYPRDLREQEIAGAVELRLEVLSSGRTGRVVLVSGVHPALDKLAMAAVKRFVWAPGEVDGEPVTTWIRHTFRFELFG